MQHKSSIHLLSSRVGGLGA
ncbi:hypothetical protein LINPERPRIM_LOCUS27927 [Linum perenne]